MKKKLIGIILVLTLLAICFAGCTSSGRNYYYDGVEVIIRFENFEYTKEDLKIVFNNDSIPYTLNSDETFTILTDQINSSFPEFSQMECYVYVNEKYKELRIDIYYDSPNATTVYISNDNEAKKWVQDIEAHYLYDRSRVDFLANRIISSIEEEIQLGTEDRTYYDAYTFDET